MTEQNHPATHGVTPAAPAAEPNPFFEAWTGAFEMPPFGRIAPAHFMPAFEHAFAEHDAEIAAVTAQAEPPSFANTIARLEVSGRLLDRVASVFFNLAGAHTNDDLLAIEREIGPKLAAHNQCILQNDALFQRIDALYRAADAGLTAEQKRVLERYHKMYRRAGAGLDAATKKRLAEIAERLAVLGTSFSQNVLADEQDYTLTLESEDDLAGLPDFVRAAARAAAAERGMEGKHVVTLSRSSVEPFLQFSSRRDLREKAFRAWIARGDQGKTDNKAIIAETVALRAERAKLLGFETFAHYRLDDAMAKTPDAVRDLLDKVWAPARAGALADRDAMQELVREEGGNFKIEPWDWRYYAEKLRKVRCDIDEATVKPYFQLHHIIDAAFYTAFKLFGLTFERRKDVEAWHPDVMAWEVLGPDGRHLGLFLGDYFARPSKRSGAWMTTLRDQEKLTGPDVRPLVVNVMNFNKGGDGQPTLLSFDDARTLFHEFGHALHGLLSDVTYPMVAGTSVLTDWVELPSQLYEHWLEQPDILRRFAIHARTGRAIPDDLLKRLIDARNFNRGFATVEFVASALFDLDAHLLTDTTGFDVGEFEQAALAKMGMPAEIVMRHRPTHFAHVFSGGGYASAYYSYMWSEVLDADAFAAFQETGDIFDPAMAKKLHDHVYSAGGKSDPEALYTAFRGRLPTADALLKQRGFAPAAT